MALFNNARADQFMQDYSLDAMVAATPASVTYLTGYYCWMDSRLREYMTVPGSPSNPFPVYAARPAGGDPVMVARPNFAINTLECSGAVYLAGTPRMNLIDNAGPVDPEFASCHELLSRKGHATSPHEALVGMLRDDKLDRSTIGLEMDGISGPALKFLSGALPDAQFKDCSNLLRLIRAVKSPDELECLKHSGRINEQAMMGCLELARPGARMSELREHFRVAVAKAGAEYEHFAYSIRGYGIASEPDHVIQPGEFLFIDTGCIARYHYSDSGTTLMMPGVDEKYRAIFPILQETVEAGRLAARPGARSSAVQRAMKDIVDAHPEWIIQTIGHGLGLDMREYPIIMPDSGKPLCDDCLDIPSDLELETGMVFNLETPVMIPSVGGLQLEKTFIVTETGCEPLFEQDRSGPVCVG
jgi:Xaa-Pro dipeptidase